MPEFFKVFENQAEVFKLIIFYELRELFFELNSFIILFHQDVNQIWNIAPDFTLVPARLFEILLLGEVGVGFSHVHIVFRHVHLVKAILALSLFVQQSAQLFAEDRH